MEELKREFDLVAAAEQRFENFCTSPKMQEYDVGAAITALYANPVNRIMYEPVEEETPSGFPTEFAQGVHELMEVMPVDLSNMRLTVAGGPATEEFMERIRFENSLDQDLGGFGDGNCSEGGLEIEEMEPEIQAKLDEILRDEEEENK